MNEGLYIYVKSNVVTGEAQHKIFSETTRKEAGTSAESALNDALGA